MHPEDIKAAIRKKQLTQAEIARGLKLSGMAVNHVIQGRQKSARIARRISEITGIPVGKLWPGKYPELEFIESLAKGKKAAAKAVQA